VSDITKIAVGFRVENRSKACVGRMQCFGLDIRATAMQVKNQDVHRSIVAKYSSAQRSSEWWQQGNVADTSCSRSTAGNSRRKVVVSGNYNFAVDRSTPQRRDLTVVIASTSSPKIRYISNNVLPYQDEAILARHGVSQTPESIISLSPRHTICRRASNNKQSHVTNTTGCLPVSSLIT